MHDGAAWYGVGCCLPRAGRLGSAGPTRRPRVRGRRATHSDGWEFRQARLHGRRLSRPALELLGPGRRERSDRRTRRVAGVSTCDTIEQHDGKSNCWKRSPFFVFGKQRAQRAHASEGERDARPKGRDRAAGSTGQLGREAMRPESLSHSTPTFAIERDSGHGNHHAHSGWLRTRCSATSRIRARS